MRLYDIQSSFKDTMIDPAMLDQNDGEFRDLFSKDGISLENRMKVYRNNVIRGLADAIIATYPIIKKLVGEKFLETMARGYVVENLPDQGNLNLYGATFYKFIETYETAKDFPYLSDMARLEWAWEESYYAIDDTALEPTTLQKLPQEQLPFVKLTFRDSIKLIESSYPLDEIYDFCKSEEVELSDETLDISQRDAKLIVFRPEYTVQTRRLENSEYAFISKLYNGSTIMEAAEIAFEIDKKFDLPAILQKYLRLGIFKDYGLTV